MPRPSHLDFITRTYDAGYRGYVHCMFTESVPMFIKYIRLNTFAAGKYVILVIQGVCGLWFHLYLITVVTITLISLPPCLGRLRGNYRK
jgi:hypothetical protein